jgi:hypothetical protein
MEAVPYSMALLGILMGSDREVALRRCNGEVLQPGIQSNQQQADGPIAR